MHWDIKLGIYDYFCNIKKLHYFSPIFSSTQVSATSEHHKCAWALSKDLPTMHHVKERNFFFVKKQNFNFDILQKYIQSWDNKFLIVSNLYKKSNGSLLRKYSVIPKRMKLKQNTNISLCPPLEVKRFLKQSYDACRIG